jgi:hypothetical protein
MGTKADDQLPELTPKQLAFVMALELTRLREQALDVKQVAAAVQAEHYRGKAAGLYEDRLRLSSGPSDAELIKSIRALLGDDVAKAISVGLGVPSGTA